MAKIDGGSQQQSIIWTHVSSACSMSYTLEEIFCFGGAVTFSMNIREQRSTACWEQLREMVSMFLYVQRFV